MYCGWPVICDTLIITISFQGQDKGQLNTLTSKKHNKHNYLFQFCGSKIGEKVSPSNLNPENFETFTKS